jgi:hypothetical protein
MPEQEPNAFEQAMQQYPILKNAGISAKMNIGGGQGYLEFWSPGEEGAPDSPRPKEFALDKPGVEIYSADTRPIDVLGDVVSHHLVNVDPTISDYYQKFIASISPEQLSILRDQYQWSKSNEGETRAYQEWLQAAGVPALFRGYAFQQWPEEFTSRIYSESQRAMFDDMMGYLQGDDNRNKLKKMLDKYEKNKNDMQNMKANN